MGSSHTPFFWAPHQQVQPLPFFHLNVERRDPTPSLFWAARLIRRKETSLTGNRVITDPKEGFGLLTDGYHCLVLFWLPCCHVGSLPKLEEMANHRNTGYWDHLLTETWESASIQRYISKYYQNVSWKLRTILHQERLSHCDRRRAI